MSGEQQPLVGKRCSNDRAAEVRDLVAGTDEPLGLFLCDPARPASRCICLADDGDLHYEVCVVRGEERMNGESLADFGQSAPPLGCGDWHRWVLRGFSWLGPADSRSATIR